MEVIHVGKITINKLIKELRRFHSDTQIYTDDGNSWRTRYVCLLYDKSDKSLSILGDSEDTE